MKTDTLIETERIAREKIDAVRALIASLPSDHDSGDLAEPLEAVQVLRMIAETASSALRQVVPVAREYDATWQQIANALGTSRQSAHERYSGV